VVPRTRTGMSADLVLHNVRIFTCDDGRQDAGLVAIRGDRILAVGPEHDLGLFAGTGVTLLDCAGATAIPGFNDAHCHPMSLAISLLTVDCSSPAVRSIPELQARIRERADRTTADCWIRATGFDEALLAEGRPPTRWELDGATSRHPVVLVHATGQSCVLNSAALQRAGICSSGPDGAGQGIRLDPDTGEPTGLVVGRQDRVARAIPPPDAGELERGMRQASLTCLAQGITSVQDTSWTNGWHQWQLWHRLVAAGAVGPRVSMMAGTESLRTFREAGLATGNGDRHLRLGAFKLALDESTGVPHPPRAEINELALVAHEAGFQLAFHVPDPWMLEVSLAAIAFVRRRCQRHAPGECDSPGFRLEHCIVCPPDVLGRLRASRATVVTQPAFMHRFGASYGEAAPPEQTGWFCPIASLRRHGIDVAFSSDAPLMGSNPFAGIQAAVTRQTDAGQALDLRQAVAARDALEMYTAGGARASLEGGDKGTIRAGMLADLALLDRDPTRLAAGELSGVKVLRTIVGGRILWEA